jgi:hypothetical protein
MPIDVPEPYGPDLLILGEIFMRDWYTIFDRGTGPRSGVQSGGVLSGKENNPVAFAETGGSQPAGGKESARGVWSGGVKVGGAHFTHLH